MKGSAALLITYSLSLTTESITSSSKRSPVTNLTLEMPSMYFSFPDDKLSIIVTLAPISDNCLTISDPMKPQPPVTRTSLFFKTERSLSAINLKLYFGYKCDKTKLHSNQN